MTAWEWIILGPIVIAALTQATKYLSELQGANWGAEAAQLVAGGISMALTLAGHFFPASVPILGGILNQPIVLQLLVGVATAALSYGAHDVAGFLQALVKFLQGLTPKPVAPAVNKQTAP